MSEAPTGAASAAPRRLRERADAYGRDAEALRAAGDADSAAAYEVIRDELRKAADA